MNILNKNIHAIFNNKI